MLATVIALHLAVAQAQTEGGPPPAPPAAAAEGTERAAATAPAARASDEEASKGVEPAAPTEEESLKSAREPVRATLRARQVPRTALNPIPSLVSAEPLNGRSTLGLWVGWSSLGGAWGQGVTSEDDLGVLGDFDWSTAELRLSAWYRRPMGRVGAVELGARMRAGWYAGFGATWFHDDNRRDRGVEVVPGLVASTRGAGGVFSLGGELPIVVTLWRDGGIFAAPKATFTYETLLYGDLTVGIRVSGAYRAAAGDAPMSSSRALLELQVLAGWGLF